MSDADRLEQTTRSTSLRERWMPQTSIRFYLVLIAIFALAMLIFQSAFASPGWARTAALLITTATGCFVTYAMTFLIGNLFSRTTAPIVEAVGSIDPPGLGEQASAQVSSTSGSHANQHDQESD